MRKSVWVTRSEPGATKLGKTLEQNGYCAVVDPVFSIEKLEDRTPPPATEVWIFVSVHSVVHSLDLVEDESKPCIAIGPATASKLRGMGLDSLVPKEHNSESIRTLMREHFVPCKVTIVAGVDGRTELSEWLNEDGFEVETWLVYQRIPNQLTQSVANIDAVIFASSAAIPIASEHLRQVSSDNDGCLSICCVVPSNRCAHIADTYGFTNVCVAESASDQATLAALRTRL